MSYFVFPVDGHNLWWWWCNATCGGVTFLWIQRVLGGRQCGAVVPCLDTSVVCAGESELEGGKRREGSCKKLPGKCMHKLYC